MKYGIITEQTQLRGETPYNGESIEKKCRRVTTTKEPIKDGAPIIYTERKQGVIPAFDPRTDRWELAQEAMTEANKSWIAQRDNALNPADEAEESIKTLNDE